jgi:hypothetical protein
MVRKQHKRHCRGKYKQNVSIDSPPQAEANGSVFFPWPPLEAVLSILNLIVYVKRRFCDKELIIDTEEFTSMPNHKPFINVYIEKQNSSVVQ